MSKKTRPKWVAWLLPGFFICLIPTSMVGAVVGKDIKSRNRQSKQMIVKFADSIIKDTERADITSTAMQHASASLETLEKAAGKPLGYGIVDAVPSVKDLFSNAEEVTYNLPVQYEKGVKTWIFRVKNTDGHPMIVDVHHADTQLGHDSIQTRIRNVLR